jgi:outer membrane murein-binding lipoprotein Lpp
MPPAPLTAGAQSSSPIGDLLSGGNPGQGVDQVRAQLEALAGQIRDVGQMVDAIAMDFPNAAQPAGQIKQLLKQIIVQAANQAPQATASGSAVPTGGSMGAGLM